MSDTTFADRAVSYGVGGFLVVLYVIFVFLVVVSFSAYVLRTEWDARLEASDDHITDLDNLVYFLKRDDELLKQINAAQGEIVARDQSILENNRLVTEAKANLTAAEADVSHYLARAVLHLEGLLPHIEENQRPRVEGLIYRQTRVSTADARAGLSIVDDLQFVAGVDKDLRLDMLRTAQQLDADLLKASEFHNSRDLEFQFAESARDRFHEDRSFFALRQREHQNALNELREGLPMTSEHRARWIEFSDARWWNIVPPLVTAPTILLTLMATIAAGALGTLVSYTRRAYSNDIPIGGTQLLITLGEGIAAAIGVFLFAGAGMLVLSNGVSAERLELSPFTVAFLAFLSGFMAEAAFDRISKFGRDLFANPVDPPDTTSAEVP